jgi:AcrR family transcriptional regulator
VKGRVVSLRDEQRELTRRRLRDAALEVIARVGYPAATIEEIAATAGASRATFYLHFRSKADLIRELVQTMPAREHIWQELGRMRDPTPADVRSWLGEVIATYDAQRLYFLAVEQAVAVEPELTEGYYRQVDHYLQNAAGAFHEDLEDARLHLMLLWVQLSRFCFLWRVIGIQLDEERTLSRLTQIWHDALGRRPTSPNAGPATDKRRQRSPRATRMAR